MKDEDPIDNALGINSIVSAHDKTIATIVNNARNDSASEDFTFARANIREVIENGTDAIAKLAQIADSSQNPRAFEVLAKLMDSMVIASEKLLDVQTKIRALDKADEPRDETAKKVTNNLFVGSTRDFAKAIEEMNKK